MQKGLALTARSPSLQDRASYSQLLAHKVPVPPPPHSLPDPGFFTLLTFTFGIYFEKRSYSLLI